MLKHKLKRGLAVVLTVCLLAVCIPVCLPERVPVVGAEQEGITPLREVYSWVLDTDGIDAGEEYLIVNSTSANSVALKKDPTNNNVTTQAVVVRDGNTIDSFDGDEDCAFVFSQGTSGTFATTNTVKSGDHYLRISTGSISFSSSSQNVSVKRNRNGYYQIYASVSGTRYVRYTGSSWTANTGTQSATYLYLYKKTVLANPTYTVYYNGNGYTEGTLPGDGYDLYHGDTYTVAAPIVALRKVDSNGDVYHFHCWNTAADGSGTDYQPGAELTMGTEDITLYAKWYLEQKYTITVRCNVDGQPHDIPHNHGDNADVYVSRDGINFIKLDKQEIGVYVTTVKDNGDYQVYFDHDGEYESAHGHMVTIYNQSGETTLQNFTVTYDKGYDGAVAEGNTDSWQDIFHAYTTIFASDIVPVRAGYTFKGWKDAAGNVVLSGHLLTSSLTEPIRLTAQWEKTTNVQVEITINHKAPSGGHNNTTDKHSVSILLMQEIDGVYQPVGDPILLNSTAGYNAAANVTTYSYTFKDLPEGNYNVSPLKSDYEENTYTDEKGVIHVEYTYAPENFDLEFTVQMAKGTPSALYPAAVNVRAYYWGYNADGVLGWHVITQHGEGTAPVTVYLDANGKGTGFYPVWKDWAEHGHPYAYRVVVSSYIMPDGTVVAADNNNLTVFTAGIYTGTLTVGNPSTPDTDPEHLPDMDGVYYEDGVHGTLTITITVTRANVTFDAGEGTIEDKNILTLKDQYAYPDLDHYTPVLDGKVFDGWYLDAACTIPAENLHHSYLSGSVTYYAKWRDHLTVSGTVTIDGLYKDGDKWLPVPEGDRATEAAVILLKETAGAYNVVGTLIVKFPAGYGDEGSVGYSFVIPDEFATYRVQVLELNYTDVYDNNGDGNYTAEEYVILPNEDGASVVNVYLSLEPQTYMQSVKVDASQIGDNYRPTEALVEYTYRDLGKYNEFQTIMQHATSPYGVVVSLSKKGQGEDDYAIWNWHTEGSLYEYQAKLTMLYGHVPGVYEQNGTAYTDNLPYYVQYGSTSWYNNGLDKQDSDLLVTIVPKQYEIRFELGFESDTIVSGMERFVSAGPDGDYYAYHHTWSYGDKFIAFPYREGYVFKGWHSENDGVLIHNNGEVTVATGLMEDVTLVAQWEKIEGTAAVVRYLEKNTNKVLHGSRIITGYPGMNVYAADEVLTIQGYVFAETTHIVMTLSSDNAENIMTIYYLPDGSDGYTEQVESNLHLDKSAVLENNGTYTVWMETFTTDNPVTTLIQQDTPMDIVLVLDQSGSMYTNWYFSNGAIRRPVDDLKDAVGNFINLIADHGRNNQVDHRVAIVGYGSNGDYTAGSSSQPTANSNRGYWANTGVFDSHGVFHTYTVTGFTYNLLNSKPDVDSKGKELQSYYIKVGEEYLLLTYHTVYRHVVDEQGARAAMLQGKQVYGYVAGLGEDGFVELQRNSSGLWLYGDKQLYSDDDFYTYHTDVWTYRSGTGPREIHAYGTGANYAPVDAYADVYTRTEVKTANPQESIYTDALVPVTTGHNGAGGVTPGLLTATQSIGASGRTYVSYGIEMANSVLAATQEGSEDRLRVVIVFTDGKPGDSSHFDEIESNRALAQSYITQHTYGASVYTIGMYGNDVVAPESDQDFFMNGLSSNYPNAQKMDDVWVSVEYRHTQDGYTLDNGGPYFAKINDQYYQITKTIAVNNYTWGFTDASGNRINIHQATTNTAPTITNHMVNGYEIYRRYGVGYQEAESTEYHVVAESSNQLTQYFANIVADITTKIQIDIVLHEDTILRDIMNQGLVLTDGTVITAYKVAGDFNFFTGQIDWARNELGEYVLEYVASLTLADGVTTSKELATIQQKDGTYKDVPYIQVYNYGSANPTDPKGEDYAPHTVDVTGYDFSQWYIDEGHPDGYMMVVQITRIEAMDDVEWSRSTQTNNDKSGLWLPADTFGERELLLPFDQPTTLFVENAYVLDYAKPFTLDGWYFDDTEGQQAEPIHIDAAIANGMNWFDPANPNLTNRIDGYYGNTKYGNVELKDGRVTYTPTTMNWDGKDTFYVFGNTQRKTVLAQDANYNGNLWAKVQVIPANNVYYEDSFITTEGDGLLNGFEGFTFDDNWSVVYSDTDHDTNTEKPEQSEDLPYGDVHGWIDDLVNESKFSDGSAHFTNGIGATATFEFTGTGVDVYTRTNNKAGVVVATLYHQEPVYENGAMVNRWTFNQGIIMDNLAVSGDYYQIPTISFKNLAHGTYKVELIASASTTSNKDDEGNWIGDTPVRTEYHIDGIRIYKPLSAEMAADPTIRDAYELELNASFTEVRDVLIDYDDFNVDMEDSTDGTAGAVFIDWIREWQGSGNDQPGVGVPTYEIGTFENYGPKNEVYLSSGQAIVLKVDPNNTYYVGLKSLDGNATIANLSGITTADPVAVQLSHTADLYYRVTPIDGYIVIQNGATNESVLSVTKLRATNLNGEVVNGGILPVQQEEAMEMMTTFSRRLMQNGNTEGEVVEPIDPTVQLFRDFLRILFGDVRAWLKD